MSKKNIKVAKELTSLGVTMGLGAKVVGDIDPRFAAGLSSAAPLMPAVGTAAGGGMLMRQLRGLEKQVKRRKRR